MGRENQVRRGSPTFRVSRHRSGGRGRSAADFSSGFRRSHAALSRDQIKDELRQYDVILAHRIEAMRWLGPKETFPPILFDLDDVVHIKLLRMKAATRSISTKAMLVIQIVRTFVSEYRAIRASTRAFVCSDRDRDALVRSLGLKNVSIIPNCIEVPAQYVFQPNKVLLFLGTYGYWPNVQAAEFMIEKILPLVLARYLTLAC
jgi:hypothetical protein